ncbi:hypothetical protein AB1Y20_023534 [Prymnesium parvum]|uniref:J domain-containing protein n=1 Tax=Prymnesium parvum TaxID=97485 RepID=A0AB34JHC8_PRYPA
MAPPARDPYVVLGASCSDSAGEIRRLYRRKSLESHPDKGGNAARFREVSEAYKLLSDPRRRKQYDRSGFRSSSDESTCGFDADGDEEEDAMTPGEVFAMCFYLFLLAVYIFAGITGAFIVAGKPVFLERVQAFATAHAIMSGLAVFTWLVHKPFGETSEGETWLPAWLAHSPSMQLFVAEWFGVTAGVLAIGVLWGLGAAFRLMLLHAVGQPWSRDSQYVCLMIPFLGEPLLCTRK